MAAEASAAVSLVKECVNLWFQYRNGAFSGEIRCRQFDMAKRQLQIMQACTTTSRSEGCEEGSVAHLLLWKVKEATNDLEDVVFKVIWLEEAWGMTGRSINQLKNIIHKLFLSRMEHSGIRAEMLGIAAKYSEIMLLQAAPTSDRFNVDAGSTSSNQRRRSETMQTSPPVSDHPILGLEENIGTLVANLKSEGCTSRVVCVWGEGGSGKSTLAGEIFKHDEVEGHFESFAWLSPPEHSEGIDIFGEILFRLDGTKSDNMKQEEVEEKLYEVLKQRKCLVVLNNIWSFSTETCGFLNKAFKEDHNSRSKLLLTTRKRNVAQQVDEDCFVIKPSYLDRDNSLELIKACLRKSGTDLESDQNMEALVGKALDECMGSQSTILPEGVIVLGRILSREKNTLDLEGRLLNRVKLCILKGKIHDLEDSSHTGLSEVFNRSYHDFSPSDHVRLKQQCFQLLASFAENSEMRVTEVCQLLMVVLDREWNVRFGQNGMSSELNEDEAYALLYDLAQRSLVSVEEVSSTGRIKTIRLKGLMRDFCVSVAKQADLQLQVIDSGNLDQEMGSFASGRTAKEVHPMTKQRMLSINGAMDDRQCRNISKNARYWGLSSFICSETLPAGSGLKKLLKRFKRLRILKLENQESFVKIAKRIGKLKFLMFLSLKCSLVKEVPSSISELKFLQTLDLRTNCALKLPNLLWKLKRLRHLCLPHEGYIVRGEEKLRLDGLISLRKLVNISIEDCDLKVLVTFRKLERLVCVRRSPGQVSFPRTDDKFDCLKSLTVEIPFGADVDISPILSCCGPSVKRLRLIGIRTLPEVNEFPPNLHKLTLKKAYLRDDPMMILGKLPYLKFLRLLAKVFNGTEMNCSQGDFKLLVSLRLEKQQHLERWNVAEGSLCHLQRLEIVECRNLSPNPDALRRAPLLREILIHEMPEQFKSEVQRQMQNLTLLLA